VVLDGEGLGLVEARWSVYGASTAIVSDEVKARRREGA
jgi:hypothetical protein